MCSVWPLAAGLLVAGDLACAQAAEGGQPPAVVPTFSTSVGYTEVRGAPEGSNGREAIVQAIPGLQYTSRGGVVRGRLNYSADLIERRGRADSAGGEVQNALDAAFVAEAVPNHLFLDAKAAISQQSVTAFGAQAVDTATQANANNRTEVRTVSLSPYARGRLGAVAEYELRATGSTTSSSGNGVNSHSASATIGLHSPAKASFVDWSLDVAQERTAFQAQPALVTEKAVLTVGVTPMPGLRLAAHGGRETADAGVNGTTPATTIYGGTLKWSPSPRTTVTLDAEHRYFGTSESASVMLRSSRTVVSYSLTHDVTRSADALAAGQTLTVYQWATAMADAAYPNDPANHDLYRDLLIGSRNPSDVMTLGTQVSTTSIARRQDLSLSWTGTRTTFTVHGFGYSTSPLLFVDGASPVASEPTVQRGYSSSLSYRLTPTTSILLDGSRSATSATEAAPGNSLKSAGLSLTTQLGRRTSAQFGGRYSVFNSPVDPYRETTVNGSLSLRF